MLPSFIGPSYNLESRPASVQRTVNMVPVPLEPGNERAGFVFRDVPGLVAAVTIWDTAAFVSTVQRTAQSIANNTWQAVEFTAITTDNGMFSVTTPTRLTVQRAGVYVVDMWALFDVDAAGVRGIQIRLNGGSAQWVASSLSPGNNTGGYDDNTANLQASCALSLVEGDYLELLAFQNSGAALNVDLATFGAVEIRG